MKKHLQSLWIGFVGGVFGGLAVLVGLYAAAGYAEYIWRGALQ